MRKKNYDLLRKNANIKGKRWKNGRKKRKLSLYLGKKSFWKKGGEKMSYFGQIFNPWSVTKINCLRRKMVPAMEKNLLANINLDKKGDKKSGRKFDEREKGRL